MQIRSNHLIRKVIRSIFKIAFFVRFFLKVRIALFMRRREYML
jgi:hypothetical protein